jgi:hypothetical protein
MRDFCGIMFKLRNRNIPPIRDYSVMDTTKKKPLPAVANARSSATTGKTVDEEVFVRCLCASIGGMLAANVYWNDLMGQQETAYADKDILQRGAAYAAEMVEIWRRWKDDESEVQRFEFDD